MQWKFLTSISILVCSLFISTISQAQDTDSIPPVKDTTLPISRTDSSVIDTIPKAKDSIIKVITDSSSAGVKATDTVPESIDPALIEMRDARNPKEYTIGGITITGTKYLDEQLLLSISGLTVGEKVLIPGGDNFSKAITNLWKQNLFANVQIYFTRLEGSNVFLEINVTERPRLSTFEFKGVKKSDGEDLKTKSGLIPGRVVTENVKRNAVDAIKKFYTEKGFAATEVTISEVVAAGLTNSVNLIFNIDKGKKVRINEINFYDNVVVPDLKLKKQMKGTKEMTKMTLYPSKVQGPYGSNEPMSVKEFRALGGILHPSTTKEFLDPYFRFKLFSSAKFNSKKYEEDKEKVLGYYNSVGFRD
ncbi:MAG TPA: POTRA domain-containing protein, partial [Flavitalea sp.]|nr:POTRA domain-containing protein [Flavitalea sp.]